jgi:hypothetical protein
MVRFCTIDLIKKLQKLVSELYSPEHITIEYFMKKWRQGLHIRLHHFPHADFSSRERFPGFRYR